MPRMLRAISAVSVLSALSALAPPALAMHDQPYGMEILVDGVPLAGLATRRGVTYVEALAGREYAIRLRNGTPERVAVALSVDGLNTIDAKRTTARDASRWILGPYQTITIEGWQTSQSTARRFFFTTESASYGAWLGDTRNLGLIAAAVFRERRRPHPIWQQKAPGEEPSPMRDESGGADARAEAPRAGAMVLEDDHAATGIGDRTDHHVRRIHFDAEDSPAAVLELRYEYREALVRLGVLPRGGRCEDPLDRRERSRGFDGMDFAPDPWHPGCR